MARTLYIIYVILLFLAIEGGTFDPCSNFAPLFSSESRGTNCFLNHKMSPVCDRLLKPGWYKAEGGGHSLVMATSCPSAYSCGTASPIWMKGKLPLKSDGVVSRDVCIRGLTKNSCCNHTMPIQVKNCGTYFVYNLTYTDSCDRAYCFGTSSCPPKIPSTVPTIKTPIFTVHGKPRGTSDPCSNFAPLFGSESRGTNCFLSHKMSPVCDRLLKPGWYKAEAGGHSLLMATSCPSAYSCGTASPIWMKGKLPLKNDGVVTRDVCIRGLTKNSCCNHTMPIQVKNCGTYFVYNLTYTDSCDRAYCFGNSGCHPKTTPTVPTIKTTTFTANGNNQGKTLPPNDPCTSYSKISQTAKRGSQCLLYGNKPAICDRLLKPGWYKAEEGGIPLDMPRYCVNVYSCGTAQPIWLNGSLPLRPFEVKRTSVCMRGLLQSECCVSSFEIMVKNCVNYNVYYLPFTNICDSGYCFGHHKCSSDQHKDRVDHSGKDDTSRACSREIKTAEIIAICILVGIIVIISTAVAYYIVNKRTSRKLPNKRKVHMLYVKEKLPFSDDVIKPASIKNCKGYIHR